MVFRQRHIHFRRWTDLPMSRASMLQTKDRFRRLQIKPEAPVRGALSRLNWAAAWLGCIARPASFCAVIIAALALTAPAMADSLIQVSSAASQKANDSVQWSQIGPDATSLATTFKATSTNGLPVDVSLNGPDSLVAVTCPANPCSWANSSGFNSGDSLIWTSDTANGGNGPITLSFGSGVQGAGALIEADGPAQFTAEIQVYQGNALLGTFNTTSDANGDATYLGVLDQTASNITSVTFSITNCTGDCTDFAIDSLELTSNVVGPTPTPTAKPTPTPTASPTPTATLTPTATPTPVNANLAAQPKTVVFPAQVVLGNNGHTSAPKAIVLSNPRNKRQDVPILLGSVSSSDPEFRPVGCSGQSLPPGGRCQISITFTPNAPGAHQGVVTVANNTVNGPQMITVKGIGRQGALLHRPPALGFGKIATGTQSPPRTVTLINRNPVPMAISSIVSTDQAEFAPSTNCVGQLNAFAICAVSVTFTPATKGFHSAKLMVSDDALNSPQAIKMSGTGK
jgi:hypothetical protein